MKTRSLFVVVVILGLLAGCSSVGGKETATVLSSAEDLAAALEAQGIMAVKGERIEQPFFSVPAVLLNTADTGIQVFEYADEAAAQADSELVASDGSSVGTSMPFWVGAPHFFHSGKLVVLYLGSDESLLTALEAVLGPQFAGR